MSKSEHSAPSWDEFRVEQHELDYDEELVCEPNNSNEYGPSLPPGFSVNDGNQDGSDNAINDFAVSNDNYDEPDDPEDPTQLRSSSARRDIGPQIPTFEKVCFVYSHNLDESFILPSISSSSDVQRPCSSNCIIGPSLPSEFCTQSSSKSAFSGFPPEEPQRQNKCDSMAIGPSLPSEFLPSVPASCSNENGLENGEADKMIGPTLSPDFCDSTSDGAPLAVFRNDSDLHNGNARVASEKKSNHFMELPLDDEETASNRGPNGNYHTDQSVSVVNDDDEEDDIIGPTLPPSNQSADEAEEEYLKRLIRLEEKTAASSSLQREEWMTELPQKLKQSYGLSGKSSFSRVSGGPESSGSNLWTDTPNRLSSSSASSHPIPVPAPSTSSVDPPKTIEKRESLFDMHQRKRKLNNNKDEASSSSDIGGRRPFNRDLDMEIHGLSKLTSEEARNRLGNLGSRFNSGSTTKKFL